MLQLQTKSYLDICLHLRNCIHEKNHAGSPINYVNNAEISFISFCWWSDWLPHCCLHLSRLLSNRTSLQCPPEPASKLALFLQLGTDSANSWVKERNRKERKFPSFLHRCLCVCLADSACNYVKTFNLALSSPIALVGRADPWHRKPFCM